MGLASWVMGLSCKIDCISRMGRLNELIFYMLVQIRES